MRIKFRRFTGLAIFARWDDDPAVCPGSNWQRVRTVGARLINDDLRVGANLFAFIAANPAKARRVLSPVAVGPGHRGARGKVIPAG